MLPCVRHTPHTWWPLPSAPLSLLLLPVPFIPSLNCFLGGVGLWRRGRVSPLPWPCRALPLTLCLPTIVAPPVQMRTLQLLHQSIPTRPRHVGGWHIQAARRGVAWGGRERGSSSGSRRSGTGHNGAHARPTHRELIRRGARFGVAPFGSGPSGGCGCCWCCCCGGSAGWAAASPSTWNLCRWLPCWLGGIPLSDATLRSELPVHIVALRRAASRWRTASASSEITGRCRAPACVDAEEESAWQ